jgi:hypothetical protein
VYSKFNTFSKPEIEMPELIAGLEAAMAAMDRRRFCQRGDHVAPWIRPLADDSLLSGPRFEPPVRKKNYPDKSMI